MEPTQATWAILGLIAQKPRSGYDLKRAIDRTIRHFWAASYGQIYPDLRRLEAAGWIAGDDAPRGGRARRIYRITPAGSAALDGWLAAADTRVELRDESLPAGPRRRPRPRSAVRRPRLPLGARLLANGASPGATASWNAWPGRYDRAARADLAAAPLARAACPPPSLPRALPPARWSACTTGVARSRSSAWPPTAPRSTWPSPSCWAPAGGSRFSSRRPSTSHSPVRSPGPGIRSPRSSGRAGPIAASSGCSRSCGGFCVAAAALRLGPLLVRGVGGLIVVSRADGNEVQMSSSVRL